MWKFALGNLTTIVLLIFLSIAALAQPRKTGMIISAEGPVHQLRIYEIFERNKRAFHNRFRDHAARIMVKYDFRIVAMWESRNDERTEFIYLLEWPNEEVMKDRWAKFMADKEWLNIKKVTGAKEGAMVGTIQDRKLKLTDYATRRTLLNK